MAKFEAQELKHTASELELPFIESLSSLIESLSIARPKIEAQELKHSASELELKHS